jgi:uncharacterized membrane protein YqaE (UPF0057 family)
MYDTFLCIICPPIALLIRGELGSVLLNIILCLFGYIPGVIRAQDEENNKKNYQSYKGAR